MKANELRIGNYISNQDGTLNNIPIGEPHIVNETDFKWAEFYVPIPLTEEWLVKFGFEKKDNTKQYGYYKEMSVYYICWAWSSCVLIEDRTGEELISWIDCKFVHQLQNLYFALTGEELTLKDKL